MKLIKIVLYIIFMISLFSCSSMKVKIQRNNRATEKAAISYLYTNGNAFYLNSTYSTKSTVWSFVEGYIFITKLENGNALISKKATTFNLSNSRNIIDEQNFEFDECMELDGDLLVFRMKEGNSFKEIKYPININCVTAKTYESEFINNLIKEIKKYIL